MSNEQLDFVLRTLEHAPDGPVRDKALRVCEEALDIMIARIETDNKELGRVGVTSDAETQSER